MRFGIPIETDLSEGVGERRVALSPAGIQESCRAGAEVLVQQKVGCRAGFPSEEGAQIVYDIREVYGRSDVWPRVERPHDADFLWLAEDATVISFIYLHGTARWLPRALCRRHPAVLGLDAICEDDGVFPLQRATSQLAGRLLESEHVCYLVCRELPRPMWFFSVPTTAFLGTEAGVYVLDANPYPARDY